MKKKKFLYCFVISLLFLLICTKSSFLYQMNDWYDVNAFFTMGKAMMQGRVPFLDLFEQKGPLLYFIYGIASLISSKTFIGVFVLEVLFGTFTLYYISKIMDIYISEKWSYIFLPILSALIFSSRSFTHGGSCEEFLFPFLAMSIYYFVLYLKTNQLTKKQVWIVGITAGILFWVKYTLLGFHIIFCMVFFFKKIFQKEYKDLFIKIGMFLLGFLVITLPIILYFALHHGLDALIQVYFLFNAKNYSTNISLFEKLQNCFITIYHVLLKYYLYIFLIFLPMIISIKTKMFFEKRIDNVFLLISCFSLLFFIFIGGTNFRYYSLPIQLFMVFGLIFLVLLFQKKSFSCSKISIVLTILISLVFCFYFSPNTKYLRYKKEDYAQFVFAKKIEKNASILNYNFLDGGFYFTTNTIPNVYYFERNNVKYEVYPNIMDSQRKYIQNKEVDYVITKNNVKKKDLKQIEENYEKIDSHTQEYEGKMVTYSLYRKRK